MEGLAVLGQSGSSGTPSAPEDRRRCDDLLRQARQALQNGDTPLAEAYLVQAERMNVPYRLFELGETPQKVRRDLESARQGGARPQAAPASDPAVRPAGFEGAAPLSTLPSSLPGSSLPGSSLPASSYPTTGALPVSGAESESERWLLEARLAMAKGDTRQATLLVGRAENSGQSFQGREDSPTKVRATLQKVEQLAGERARGGAVSEAYRRRHVDCLLEQAESLVRWNMLDEAERLATDARRVGVAFSPFENSPEKLLDQITDARRVGRNTAASRMTAAQPAGPLNMGPNSLPGSSLPGSSFPGSSLSSLPSTPTGSTGAGDNALHQQAQALLTQARESLGQGQWDRAERLARQAQAINPQLTENAQQIVMEVSRVRSGERPGAVVRAAYGDSSLPPSDGSDAPKSFAGKQADYQETTPPVSNDAMELFNAGELALQNNDLERARMYYEQALNLRTQLDAATVQRLQDKLQLLSRLGSVPSRPVTPVNLSIPPSPLLQQEAAAKEAIAKQLVTEVSRKEYEARNLKETDPEKALRVLQDTHKLIETSAAEANLKGTLLRRVDRSASELQSYLSETRPLRELAANNKAIKEDINRSRQYKVEVETKLAKLVDEFNRLIDEERWPEAEQVAKKAHSLSPDEPIVEQMMWQSKFVHRYQRSLQIKAQAEQGVVSALSRVDESAIPFDDGRPYQHGDIKTWEELTQRRKALDRRKQRLTDRELEIQSRLRTPVAVKFNNKSLSEVIEYLGALAEINIFLDPVGLSEEGVNTNTPVTLNLSQPVMLKSALNMILEPHHLTFVIKNEALKITSEQLGNGEVYQEVYNVADLVIPIPNFVPSGNMGLAQALNNALSSHSKMPGAGGHAPITVMASQNGGTQNAMLNPNVLAQSGAPSAGNPGFGMDTGGMGPGGLGGGVFADFDSLIDLVTSTVAPTTWDGVGGPGSVQPFPTNLSLVISQTQQVHEQIADLLEQLRRLQDLQVTIEVRFITLSDDFFERIGLDFDFDINDNTDRPFQVFGNPAPGFTPIPSTNGQPNNPARDLQDRDHYGRTVSVGLQAPGVFSADLDIPFQNGSFGLATPSFGGYQPGAGAQLGFAILSDIETFFFIEASQGDRRSNVLQAPKVTLFNGQLAFVADTSQSPFVISVIPVVGDFAAGFQPVIVVLSEGTFLTVQAVVSPDRRFVRLTLVPFFSSIGDVDTFTFQGSETTITNSASTSSQTGTDDKAGSTNNGTTTIRSGTTVQLPTFAFVTVTTTVSVPDGGTVLLGGIKRLSEGRNEFGVPILNHLPYINRLFRNVGIGREAESLMMMVTPRIIIQEEEEQLLIGGGSAP